MFLLLLEFTNVDRQSKYSEVCYHNKVIISGYDGLSSWLYLGMVDNHFDQLVLSF